MPPKSSPAAPVAAEKATPAGERIAKVLSRAGIASRREAERLIEIGEVAVNGKVITSPALNVTDRDKITVGGKPVAAARLHELLAGKCKPLPFDYARAKLAA